MAAGTVGYSDTRGNKDYLSIIASQVGKRVSQASDMAGEERAYASQMAEAEGTSLEEAGIGKGYFFGRALGSRFGGDRIARTRGSMGAKGAGKNPAASYKQRFRGGFDYKVTNNVITDVAPISNALVTGLRSVQTGLTQVSGAITQQGIAIGKLSNVTADMAKATMFNGYVFQMLVSQQRAQRGKDSLSREEARIEGGRIPRGSYGGFGGSGRGMINVTPGAGGGIPFKGGRGGGGRGVLGPAGALFGTLNAGGLKRIGAVTGLGTTAKTGLYADDVLRGAAKSMKGLDPASVGKNIARFVNADASMFAKFIDAGSDGIKAAESVTGGMGALAKTGGLTVDGIDALDFMISMEAAGKGDLASELLDANIRSTGFNKGTNMDSVLDYDVFRTLTDSKGRKLYSKKQVEIFRDLGLSPGAKNVARYNRRVARAGGAAYVKNMRSAGTSAGGLAEQIAKYYPNVKFSSLTEAGVLTEFARYIDQGVKPKEAVTLVRKAFGSQATDSVLVKGGKLAAKNSKVAAALAKAGGRSFMKKLPLIGAVMGTVFAIDRMRKGDFLGAGLEFSSGMLGLIPGAGTGLGLGIDGFLLARDMGMAPMAKGGIVKGVRGKGLPMMLGGLGGTKALVGEGGDDEAVLPLNKKTFTSFGIGVMDAMQLKKSDFVKNLGMGVFSGIGSARSGGLFDGLVTGVGETLTNVKDSVGNVLQKINPANLFKPDANGQNFFQRIGSGVTNWWNKGAKPNESKMSWRELISDDWNQRQRTQGPNKGSWNPLRGMPGYGTVKNFLTGKPGNEIAGGFQTGPTPLIRQSVLRGAGLLMNPKAAILAALMKPTALADGTMDAYMNSSIPSIGDSMNLTTPLGSGQFVTPTIINNNYYNSSGGKVGDGEDASVPFASLGMDAFMVNYSLSTK